MKRAQPSQSSKKYTIMDIAKDTGVSKTTISRYLNGKYEYMSTETRGRIEESIRRFDYRPSNIARALKSRHSMMVGVVLSDIGDPFSAGLIRGMTDALFSERYTPLIVHSNNDSALEREHVFSLIDRNVEGLIVNTVNCNNQYLQQVEEQEVPLVLCDRMIKGYRFNLVAAECIEAFRKLVDYHLDQGAGCLGYISLPYEHTSPRYLRLQAFLSQMKQRKQPCPEEQIYVLDPIDSARTGRWVEKLLRQCGKAKRPAIIAANTVTLMHMVDTITQMGLQIPNDLSLSGTDDWDWAYRFHWPEVLNPRLATVQISPYDIGYQAAELLLSQIKSPSTTKKEIWIPAKLVIRDSQ